MDEAQQQFEKQRLIEEAGLLAEMEGLPRMAGRIVGCLLVSESPLLSITELADLLQVTKGAISTTSRLLIQTEVIERVSLPGDRRDYFRLKRRPWSHLFKREIYIISAYRRMVEEMLNVVTDYEFERKEALREMCDLYAFFEREFPALLDRWEQEREQNSSQDTDDPTRRSQIG